MIRKDIQVLIIDDNYDDNRPLVIKLKEQYEVVRVFKNPNEGLDYALDNLIHKLIVILDIDFGTNSIDGHKVFQQIRSKTRLVEIIIMTAKDLDSIDINYFGDFINQNAFAFISSTEDYEKIIKYVNKAAVKLDSQIDSLLEKWIEKKTKEERKKPFILTKEGKKYDLNNVLKEIRLQTAFGKEFEKNILRLAIDLLSRGKEKIND